MCSTVCERNVFGCRVIKGVADVRADRLTEQADPTGFRSYRAHTTFFNQVLHPIKLVKLRSNHARSVEQLQTDVSMRPGD